MAERPSSQKPVPGKAKLVMIPVLGAVLLYVVCSPSNEVAPPVQLARAPVPSTSTSVASTAAAVTPWTPTTARGTAALPASEASSKSGSASATAAVVWPATPLAEVLSVNPFQMPTELMPAVAVAEVPPQPLAPDRKELAAEKFAELQAAAKGQRLAALVRTSKGVGAIVGDRVVGVGDLIGDRLRVTAIRPEGVEVELIDQPASTDSQGKRSE